MATIKFTTKCGTCGEKAEKGTGDIRKGDNGKWVATCDTCLARKQQHLSVREISGACKHCGTTTNVGRVEMGDLITTVFVCDTCSAERFVAPVARVRQAHPAPAQVRMVHVDGMVGFFSPDDVYDAMKDGFRRV